MQTSSPTPTPSADSSGIVPTARNHTLTEFELAHYISQAHSSTKISPSKVPRSLGSRWVLQRFFLVCCNKWGLSSPHIARPGYYRDEFYDVGRGLGFGSNRVCRKNDTIYFKFLLLAKHRQPLVFFCFFSSVEVCLGIA